jgi:hypothetical protein
MKKKESRSRNPRNGKNLASLRIVPKKSGHMHELYSVESRVRTFSVKTED